MPVIAVTGATGFVGRSTLRALSREFPGATLRALVRNPDRRDLPDALEACTIVPGDLQTHAALDELLAGSDCVVHIAAAVAGNSEATFDEHNVAGTRRLVDAVADAAPGAHFVEVSSLAARRPELSWYAASKRAAEELVASRLDQYSILRPPAVYGPDDPALAGFWRLLARGWLIRPGRSGARFSLLHVDDLAETICRLVRRGPAGRVMPLAGPQPDAGWSWRAIATTARAVRGRPVRIVPIPAAALRSAAVLGLIAGRTAGRSAMLTPGKARELLYRDWVCDNLAINHWLGWTPATPLERALGTLPGWSRA